MARRPKVFELQDIKAELRELGVPEGYIDPTISYMRLVIPLVIRHVGVDGILQLEASSAEFGLAEEPGWVRKMAPYIEQWARVCLEKYQASRP